MKLKLLRLIVKGEEESKENFWCTFELILLTTGHIDILNIFLIYF